MSKIPEIENVETLNSPLSRVFLLPKTDQIINCAMGFKYPINIESLKLAFSNSIMVTHPRFSSLIVQNPNGAHHWKKTHVNIDEHFIIHNPTPDSSRLVEEEEEVAVNAYLADLAVSSPLNKNKPLWEVHVLVGLNCIVLRFHHGLGDGSSLMSMLSTCFGPKNEMINGVNGDYVSVKHDNYVKNKWKKGGLWGLIMSLWFTIVFALRLVGRILWVKDELSMISGGDGVELWPRKLVTAKFKIEDFKSIKMVIPNATVNDVLTGVITSGLSKYIHVKSTQALKKGIHLTSMIAVDLRQNPCLHIPENSSSLSSGFSSWGNKSSIVLLPTYYCNGLSPLDHVKTIKKSMDQKKQSYEAHLVNSAIKLLTFLLGPKAASWCIHRTVRNTTLIISNIMGPSKEIIIADNPVTYIRVNISALRQAITMHMVSYAGNADLQIMVAKDIITEPEFLVKCFQESLIEMKNSIKMNDIV